MLASICRLCLPNVGQRSDLPSLCGPMARPENTGRAKRWRGRQTPDAALLFSFIKGVAFHDSAYQQVAKFL